MEDALKGAAADVEARLSAVAAAFSEVRTSVAALPTPVPKPQAMISNEPLGPQLTALIQLVKNGDFKAQAQFARVEAQLRTSNGEAEVTALASALNRYDFEAAAALLGRMQQAPK